MSEYTRFLEDQTYLLDPDDENYEEKLLEIAASFRSFGEAMEEFLPKHGFQGNVHSAEEKTGFLRHLLQQEGIPEPRNLKKWMSGPVRPGRGYALLLGFAFHLSLPEMEEFLQKICLDRGFDCHNLKEAVFYYCFLHGLPYDRAQKILARLPEKNPNGKISPDGEIFYTGTIADYIEQVPDEETLCRYLTENLDQFGYNHVTATLLIRDLWKQIADGEKGLALREGRILQQYTDPEAGSEDHPVMVEENPSTWKIYCQMLGIDRHLEHLHRSERSIKSVLTENALLPQVAEDSFPDRNGITKILNGEHVSDETVRKWIILLTFYRFWARQEVEAQELFFKNTPLNAGRSLSEMNRYLVDAGFPELYCGNPFDWIFLWAAQTDAPLMTFRSFMGEVFAVKSEEETTPENPDS